MDAPTPTDEPGASMMALECPIHGRYTAWRVAGTRVAAGLNDCPRCIDAKQAAADREGREKAARQLADIASIPPRFATATFDGYQVTTPGQARALAICRGYAASWSSQCMKGGSLVLTGGTGTGKTRLACTVANTIIPEHMASVCFGTVSSITRTVRATYGRHSDRTEAQAIADLLVPDLLIIDEIGASTGSDHELGLLFEIINRRYEHLRPMIVVSNLNADDLRKLLGQRVMDRFDECATVVAFDWGSWRAKGGAA